MLWISGGIKFWEPVEDSITGGLGSITVRMEGWNTYLLFMENFGMENWVGVRGGGKGEESFVLFFSGAIIVIGRGLVGWGRKSYLGPAKIASFSSRDFSRSNKHDTFWHAVTTTEYFYVLFLWAIAISDFCPLEIYKKLKPSLV